MSTIHFSSGSSWGNVSLENQRTLLNLVSFVLKTSLGGDCEEVEDFIIWQWNGDIAARLGFRKVLIQPHIENFIQTIFLLGDPQGENLCASHQTFPGILTAKVAELTISAGDKEALRYLQTFYVFISYQLFNN
jgi:hypothetical protein